jgi:Chaperone of endosialidase
MTGSDNTANGFSALSANTTGALNTAIGFSALKANTGGTGNAATGEGSLESNTLGSYNTASGDFALNANTTAGQNVAVGSGALQTQSFTNAGNAWYSNNVAVGCAALYRNQPTATFNGIDNTALGFQALENNTTGNGNTASGFNALQNNMTGNGNTASGYGALNQITTGNDNTAIGDSAGGALTLADHDNICLNNGGAAGDTGTIRIGFPTRQTKAFIAGIRGMTTANPNAIAVLIDSNGQLGTVSSSRRYKEDIADMADASARLLALRPVTFHYKKPYADGGKPTQYGLIAEEVAETFPELAVLNDQGQPETVKYQDLAPLLLNEFLKEHARVKDLETRIAELEARGKDR